MNTLETHSVLSPYGKTEECAKFIIDTTNSSFLLSDVAIVGEEYTMSLWIKADAIGSVSFGGVSFPVSAAWARYYTTFEAENKDILLGFDLAGTYYVYHPQLELGNQATDWTPAPEDTDDAVQAVIELLDKSIRMAVTRPDGESAMTQTADGWTFDMSTAIDKTARDELETLGGRITGIEGLTDYVKIKSVDDHPCIELGESENDFKLRITNTQIQFIDGASVPAYIANQNGVSKLMIEKAEVKGELQIGDFVWQKRSNGNVGLMWIGGNG